MRCVLAVCDACMCDALDMRCDVMRCDVMRCDALLRVYVCYAMHGYDGSLSCMPYLSAHTLYVTHPHTTNKAPCHTLYVCVVLLCVYVMCVCMLLCVLVTRAKDTWDTHDKDGDSPEFVHPLVSACIHM